jgi:copper chaperone CopZ
MKTVTYTVPNISCGHCVHTIKTEVGELAGVRSVEADWETKVVTIGYDDPATQEQIEALL